MTGAPHAFLEGDMRVPTSLFAGKSHKNYAKELIMKRYLLLIGFLVAAVCSSLSAQNKIGLQSNATVLGILQGSAGKTVELHLNSGEKIGGRVEQVTDNVVHLSHLTGAEFFDAFVDGKDISAVVIRTGGK
jgi:hypothetical protein